MDKGSPREVGIRKYWNQRANQLVGRKIVSARYTTKQDLEEMGIDWWNRHTVLITFDDHSQMLAVADDEANASGVLMWFGMEGERPLPHIDLEE